MRLIVAGSRDFNDYELLKSTLVRVKTHITQIVSGTAVGADRLGAQWARENDIPVIEFPANWIRYGKSAGYRRNQQMAANADALIAFWNGISKGTKHMIDIAAKENLKYFVVMYIERRK